MMRWLAFMYKKKNGQTFKSKIRLSAKSITTRSITTRPISAIKMAKSKQRIT